MNIWLINHYAVPPQYYPLARQTYFAKYLQQMGHTVKIISASSVHNSKEHLNLITDGSKWREEVVDGIDHVYIRCCDYEGNGLKRIYNMCEFAWKLPGVCKKLPKPDAIVATSMPPMSCAMGIRIARKYGVKGVAEIADLWPESIVAFGIAGPHHPAVLALRRLEKWIYTKADAIVFTMEGAYDYIVEQGWEKDIPRSKVHYINNGVDLEAFNYNKEHYQIDDSDLENEETFKVVYAGSIRPANGLDRLVDCAEKLKDKHNICFLIYGAGEDLQRYRDICSDRHLRNCIFKGPVEKKYIPYILSRANLNVLNYDPGSVQVFRFGSSNNKLFEYLASGKPVLTNCEIKYSPIDKYECGQNTNLQTSDAYAAAVLGFHDMSASGYEGMCERARLAAGEYDFKKLTEKLIKVIEGT